MNELNSVQNIKDILNIKLRNLENKCCELGYIKENSIKIKNISSGFLNPTIFVPFIEYKVNCDVDIFKPNVNDIYLVDVLSINKIGIMCYIKYTYGNKTFIPMKIIISKHTQDVNIIKNIKKGDKIYVKILGFKFSKNSNNIDSIANILSEEEIQNIKKLKLIINELINIEHNCNIEDTILNKYINILKFILDKTDITKNELFVYHFINKKKITILNMNFVDLYNDYINNFYNITNKNEINISNKIIEDDLSNIEIDNDTNCETNPEDETIEEDNDYIKYNEEDDYSENDIAENEAEEEESEDDDDDDLDTENLEDKNENDKTKKNLLKIENKIKKLN
tara:strand:+ start:1980 stop:2993 length:1014 start_codon:yes stop_codon:yes gene_type:complete